MQVCTLLQTDNHASTPPLSFLQANGLPAAQPTASKHYSSISQRFSSLTGKKGGPNRDWLTWVHLQNWPVNGGTCGDVVCVMVSAVQYHGVLPPVQ